MLCHYCGRTWHVRLCRSGHENPPDAQFCGTCGSADLTETAGPVPIWVWLIRICCLIVFILFLFSLSTSQPSWNDQYTAMVIAIVLFFIAINIALSWLPGPIRNIFLQMARIPKRMCMRVIVWFWEKLKNAFS
jgi:hypothetical protein